MIDLFLLSQISPDIHKTCLAAKDYLGCVEVISGKHEKTNPKNSFNGFEKNDLNEECGAEGWCIAKRGKDILDMPKIIGWLYREYPAENEVTYHSPLPFKVKVRGEFGRYIHTSTILRYYKKPKAGTPSSIVGGGYADTNCYGVVDQVSMNDLSFTSFRSMTKDWFSFPGTIFIFFYLSFAI